MFKSNGCTDLGNPIPCIVKGASRVSVVEVGFDNDPNIRTKSLYANGRMQVQVIVLMTVADDNGEPVEMPPEVLASVKLVHYNGGENLKNGWGAVDTENEYLHDLPGTASLARASAHHSSTVANAVPRSFAKKIVFWVSASAVGSTRIAAQVKIGGTVFTTNGTLPGRHDKSVTLTALLPNAYSGVNFHFDMVHGGKPWDGVRIHKYYVGLYPIRDGGVQTKLLNWSSANNAAGASVEFFQVFNQDKYKNLPHAVGFMVDKSIKEFSWASLANGGRYKTAVNERDGMLTIVQMTVNYAGRDSNKQAVFPFSAFDAYGTEHRLRIRTDLGRDNVTPDKEREYFVNFILERN
ncbi:hypothetical protein ACIQVE_21855 [Pseudomonas sp. NPDC098747]|uniref:hypothetical protein n=1 Tax=Pseudomonas sp. NPDC098747 TaxID=3364487 RepID=UPI00383B2190